MEDDNMVFIKSEKGKDVLLKNGYKYYFRGDRKDGSNWRCANTTSCSASITIDRPRSHVLRQSVHTCKPNDLKNKIDICVNNCRLKVTKTMKPIQKVYEKEFESLKENASVRESQYIPEFKSVKDSLSNRRYQALGVKKSSFDKIEDIILPEIICEDFLISDKHNIFVFATPLAKDAIKTSTSFLGDGTFKVTPTLFYQLYTLHIDFSKSNDEATTIVPVIYALLPNKLESTYELLFSILKEKLSLNVKHFKCDYEIAVTNG